MQKGILRSTSKVIFSFWPKLLSFCCFQEFWFWRDQRSQFENDTFSKKNCYVSLKFVSNLRKKVFSGEPVKCVFLYGWNNSDSVIFGSAAFGEIKDHSLSTKSFQKKFAMGVLGLYLPYVKRYFQEHQLSAFFFMAQITQILLFSGMPLLERSKITVWERHLFKRKFTMEVLTLNLLYLKKYF